jgi:hypothetical protein
MGNIHRSGRWAFGLTLMTTLALPLAAQEPPAAKPGDQVKAPAEKRANDPSRRVPPYFGQIGLTADQKEEVYKVRGKHQPRIDALQKQIAQVQAEMLTECEALLTDAQKQALTARREAGAYLRKNQTKAASTPPKEAATPPG